MTPIPKSLLISLLAVCLLVPGVVEGHEKSPKVAGHLTPIAFGASYLIWAMKEGLVDAIFEAPSTVFPGLGHVYVGDKRGAFIAISTWLCGAGLLSLGAITSGYEGGLTSAIPIRMYPGYLVIVFALLYDAIHAPIAAKRHNEKHAREKVENPELSRGAESSRLTIYPTLALGKEYVGIGVGVGF